jgi:type III pantothenate kinase
LLVDGWGVALRLEHSTMYPFPCFVREHPWLIESFSSVCRLTVLHECGCNAPAMSANHAEFLLIDNSNSFTKFALATRSALAATRKLRTRELDARSLSRVLRGWRFESVVMCSVVPEKGALLAAKLRAHPFLAVNAWTRLGIGIEYPKPRTIGADRLANAVSATHFYGAPVVVVDFGTAVTFDIISRERNYVGGVIAPGLEAMTDYLHQRTALLPTITLREPPGPIGKTTRHAMLAGAIYGYRGLVREILGQIRGEIGRAKVVATGGYAGLIASGVSEISEVREHLTLEGLRLIAQLNF